MNLQHSGAATLPKGFRFHDPDQQNPKTPEPSAMDEELQPPSPPRPRLRLKRRVASNLNAPTTHFLASVAAADVPIPSIEEPESAGPDTQTQFSSMTYPVIHNLNDLNELALHKLRGRRFSPPKTPAPGAAPSLSPRRYPNWSIDSAFSSGESTPECESSRPSTARSTQTSASLFSRFSLASEDLQCISPETDASDHVKHSFFDAVEEPTEHSSSSKPKAKRRKAPWTKAMSDHLWATYLTYLQDPKVTPFRAAKSGVPPHGVCLRVAREAKRSWRGPKGGRKSLNPKSGSSTPTIEACTFLQWPHTCASTRAHLRDLCKLKAASSSARTSKFLANSPTPFGRTAARFWNRRSTPARSPSVFSAHDMSMSLTLSTSEAMQPQGPLAQLTKSEPEPPAQESMTEPFPLFPMEFSKVDAPLEDRPRLGTPFMANSYGPSSTGALAAAVSSVPQRQNQSLGHRRTLQSPARLTRSRSNTQKRVGRTRQASHEPRKTKRPSLVSDLWTEPMPSESLPKTPVKPEVEFSSTDRNSHDDLFVPRTSLSGLFTAPMQIPASRLQPANLPDPFLAAPTAPPARLGSPFPGTKTSFSFPNRFTHPEEFDHGTIRPFATIQQQASGDGGSAPPRNLADRLAYIDERLRNFRRRDSNRRRSESPF